MVPPNIPISTPAPDRSGPVACLSGPIATRRSNNAGVPDTAPPCSRARPSPLAFCLEPWPLSHEPLTLHNLSIDDYCVFLKNNPCRVCGRLGMFSREGKFWNWEAEQTLKRKEGAPTNYRDTFNEDVIKFRKRFECPKNGVYRALNTAKKRIVCSFFLGFLA